MHFIQDSQTLAECSSQIQKRTCLVVTVLKSTLRLLVNGIFSSEILKGNISRDFITFLMNGKGIGLVKCFICWCNSRQANIPSGNLLKVYLFKQNIKVYSLHAHTLHEQYKHTFSNSKKMTPGWFQFQWRDRETHIVRTALGSNIWVWSLEWAVISHLALWEKKEKIREQERRVFVCEGGSCQV